MRWIYENEFDIRRRDSALCVFGWVFEWKWWGKCCDEFLFLHIIECSMNSIESFCWDAENDKTGEFLILDHFDGVGSIKYFKNKN